MVSHVTSMAEEVYSNNHAYTSLSSNIYNGKQFNCDLHLTEEYKYIQNIIAQNLLCNLLTALCTRDMSLITLSKDAVSILYVLPI
jgi:hypothetical protein